MNGDEILAQVKKEIARNEHANLAQRRYEADRLAERLNEIKRQAEDDRMAENKLHEIFARSPIIEWLLMGHPNPTPFIKLLQEDLMVWRKQRFF